jgi:hypothetical protein
MDDRTPDLENRYSFGLTISEVRRYRDITRRESGIELTEAEAWSRAIELLALFRMLLGPLPEDRGDARFEHPRA